LLERIDGRFAWLEGIEVGPARALPAVEAATGHELVAAAGLQYWGRGIGLEAVRFAGANRLQVEFSYHGRLRRVEPYSLRRAQTGNLLLYAWELAAGKVKAFNVAKMSGLRATSVPFTPRYRVEFTATAPLVAPSVYVQPRRSTMMAGPRITIGRPRRTARPRTASMVYVYRCSVCGKQFRRASMDPSMNAHKNRAGYPCYGRYGTYVGSRYS
jgi:hypothetical protein